MAPEVLLQKPATVDKGSTSQQSSPELFSADTHSHSGFVCVPSNNLSVAPLSSISHRGREGRRRAADSWNEESISYTDKLSTRHNHIYRHFARNFETPISPEGFYLLSSARLAGAGI